MTGDKLASTAMEIYQLLKKLDENDRPKAIKAAQALLGDSVPSNEPPGNGAGDGDSESSVGPRARQWMNKSGISIQQLQEVFHFDGDDVEITGHDVPGSSKKTQSQNCYLLCGIRAFLATDQAKFNDADAVKLCEDVGCYDSGNNASTRKEIGMGGDKKNGFTLTQPLLRDAAKLIKEMAQV